MKEIYPLTIVADRYQGAYSGALFLAFNLDNWMLPDEIGGGDGDEMGFFESDHGVIIGKGKTPAEAYADLKIKLNESNHRAS